MTEIIITSSVLILVIVAVRYLLKGELSVRVQYALWLPVAVRLLVPGTILASTFSVLNAAPALELPDQGNIYISDRGITAQQPPPQVGYANSSVGSNGEYIAGDRYEFYYPPGSEDIVFCPADAVPPEGYTTVPASHILPTPKAALTVIWYIGMAAMGGWFLWVNLSFRKKLRAGRRRVDVSDCPLPVFVAGDIHSPCLVGLFRPAVYVTPACLEDRDRLRHVLAHELAHWRHRDPFWSLVRCVCLTVYWFHPLVWLAASLSRRDCELACDESALRELGEEERTAYGRTLIGLIEVSASPVRLLQTATTMVDRKGGVKERLLFIAKKPRVVALTGVIAVLIAAIAAACTFTGAAEPSAAYATVEEALADMPEHLRSEPEGLGGITAYTPEVEAEFIQPELEEGELLRGYWRIYLYLSSNLQDPLGWMGSVYRMDQAGYDQLMEAQGLMGRTLNSYWECFAKDGNFYYLIYAPLTAPELKTGLTEGAELQAELIAWMKSAVLSAQGVTAFDGERMEVSGPSWPTSAQQEELEALQRDISVRPGDVDWPEDPTPNALAQVLAQKYFSVYTRLSQDNPMRLDSVEVFGLEISDMDDFDQPTEILFSCSTAVGRDRPHIAGLGAGPEITYEETGPYAGKWVQSWQAVIAKRDTEWYFDAIGGGMTIDHTPAGPAAAFTGTAEEAFRMLLNGDNSLLADGPEARAWIDYGYDHSQLNTELGFVYIDVDGDGVIELYLQNTLGPEALNAVFDYRDGAIHCWRFDIMDGSEFQYALMDGTMVCESHFSDAVTYRIFRYTPDGEQEDVGSLAYTPAGGFSGDNGEPASWQVDGQPVTEEEFNRAMTERITSQRLTAGVQPNSPAGPTFFAEEAFRRVFSSDNSSLAEGDMERYWADNFSNEDLVYLLMDVDGDGEAELLLQHKSGPAASNAVLDCRYGFVYVWQADYAGGSSFDYPLRDGRMVSESHSGYSSSYAIYRYGPMGDREYLESFYHASAGGWSGETGEPEIWQHNGEDVTQEEFEQLMEKQITSQMLEPSMWQEVSA